MSLLTKTNIKEHCRTCLKILTGSTQSEKSEFQTDDVPESKNIHFNISNDLELQQLICINVDGPPASDNLVAHDYPENVCFACYNKLYSFAIFRRRAQQSAEKLRIVLNCSGTIKVEINFEESQDEPEKNESVGASYQACKFQLHDATAESEETFFDTSAANLADVELNDGAGDPFSPSPSSISGDSMDRDFTDEEGEEKKDDMIAVEKKVAKEGTSGKIITRQKAAKKVIVKQIARKPKPPKEIKKDKYRCPQCNEYFAKCVELTEHVNQVHPIGSRPFFCDYCHRSYRDNRNLKEHVLQMHQDKIKEMEDHVQCSECPKAFLDKNALKKHMGLHFAEKKTKVCGICGEAFAVKKWLIEHLRTHTPDGKIPCWQCDKTYTSSDTLENHMRAVHLKEKPHYCPICDKYLQNKQSFRIHNYRHSGKKPHLCDICGQDFRQLTQMKTHRLTHFKNERSNLV